VIGASIAFHLAEAGVEDVLLVERAELAWGSTSKGAGGVRAMFSDELNVEMQNRLGVPSRMLSADEAHELSPLAGLDGVLAAAFCPLAGHATPSSSRSPRGAPREPPADG
jgi:sarcosine oxidase subunit beta